MRLMNKNGAVIHFGILFRIVILETYPPSCRDLVVWFEFWHFLASPFLTILHFGQHLYLFIERIRLSFESFKMKILRTITNLFQICKVPSNTQSIDSAKRYCDERTQKQVELSSSKMFICENCRLMHGNAKL